MPFPSAFIFKICTNSLIVLRGGVSSMVYCWWVRCSSHHTTCVEYWIKKDHKTKIVWLAGAVCVSSLISVSTVHKKQYSVVTQHVQTTFCFPMMSLALMNFKKHSVMSLFFSNFITANITWLTKTINQRQDKGTMLFHPCLPYWTKLLCLYCCHYNLFWLFGGKWTRTKFCCFWFQTVFVLFCDIKDNSTYNNSTL